jgi:hypothetical protein
MELNLLTDALELGLRERRARYVGRRQQADRRDDGKQKNQRGYVCSQAHR